MAFVQKLSTNEFYTEETLKKIERDVWSMLLRNKDGAFTSSTGVEIFPNLFLVGFMQ